MHKKEPGSNGEDKFYKEAFKGLNVPGDIRKAAIDICRNYNLKGICDPGFIANTIALCTGRGDGKTLFDAENEKEGTVEIKLRFIDDDGFWSQAEHCRVKSRVRNFTPVFREIFRSTTNKLEVSVKNGV